MPDEFGMALLIPIIGVMIPIIFLILGTIIAISALKHRAKRTQLEHEERMLALEKGASLPEPVIPEAKQRNPYLWAFILIAFGLALGFGFLLDGDQQFLIWGMIFFLVGWAILAAHLFYRRERTKKEEDKPVNLGGNSPELGSA